MKKGKQSERRSGRSSAQPSACGVMPSGHSTDADAEIEHGLCPEITEVASIGCATLSVKGVILAVSQVGARLLGRPRPRLVGKHFIVLAARISRATLHDSLEQAVAGAARQTCEIELDPLLGAALHLRLWVTCVKQRETPILLLVFNDITDAKAREEKLLRATAAASEAIRRKDEFLAVLSHALRGPLAPIRHCLFLLERVAPTGEQAEKARTVIERGVRHLTRLVDDLLDLTRTTRGKLRLHREQVDFNDVVRRATEKHKKSCRDKRIALLTSLPSEHLWTYGDPTRLNEAMGTIVANVERFTPPGGRIVVTLERTGGRAKLRVGAEVRTGPAEPGQPPTNHLEGPFAPARETVERAAAGGLGLRLAMLKGELELHGGLVEVEADDLGHGRAIAVELPLEDPPSSTTGEANGTGTPSRKVLVIEDLPDAADSLGDALRLVGHQVEVAYNGRSGIERARELRPEVVICDIAMPGLDGYQVARILRADDCLGDTYLIALTGHAAAEDLDRAKRAGFDEHVAKPASIETLQSLLGTAARPRPKRDLKTPQ